MILNWPRLAHPPSAAAAVEIDNKSDETWWLRPRRRANLAALSTKPVSGNHQIIARKLWDRVAVSSADVLKDRVFNRAAVETLNISVAGSVRIANGCAPSLSLRFFSWEVVEVSDFSETYRSTDGLLQRVGRQHE